MDVKEHKVILHSNVYIEMFSLIKSIPQHCLLQDKFLSKVKDELTVCLLYE